MQPSQRRPAEAGTTNANARPAEAGTQNAIIGTVLGVLIFVAATGVMAQPAAEEPVKKDKDVKLQIDPAAVLAQPRTAVLMPFEGKLEGAQALRANLYTVLAASSALRLTNPAAVDAVLAANGVGAGDMDERDIAKLHEWLGSDIYLFGKVDKWSRTYLLVQSQAVVQCTIRAIDSETGKTLVTATVRESHNAGLTQVPTGIFGAAVSPLSVLKKRTMFNLAGEVAAQLGAALTNPALLDPALPAPVIESATFSVGAQGTTYQIRELRVDAKGVPGSKAFVHFGEARNAQQMAEPAPGQYLALIDAAAKQETRKVHVHVVFNAPGGGISEQVLDPAVDLGVE